MMQAQIEREVESRLVTRIRMNVHARILDFLRARIYRMPEQGEGFSLNRRLISQQLR